MARAVVCGDLHLYYPGTNRKAVDAFMEMLDRRPPDELVLGGDIYELWRRDLFGSAWESARFTSLLYSLRDRGVVVSYVVGNHDEWAERHTAPNEGYVATPVMDYEFQMDGETYFVTHGHKYEALYNPATNDTLSISDDYTGEAASNVWGARPRPPGASLASTAFIASLGPAASFLDPTAIRNQPQRIDAVTRGVMREKGDRYALFGHTHTPYVDDESRIANWGAMSGSLQTYIEVDEGKVRLLDVDV